MDKPTREKYGYIESLQKVQGLEKEMPPPLEEWDQITPNTGKEDQPSRESPEP